MSLSVHARGSSRQSISDLHHARVMVRSICREIIPRYILGGVPIFGRDGDTRRFADQTSTISTFIWLLIQNDVERCIPAALRHLDSASIGVLAMLDRREFVLATGVGTAIACTVVVVLAAVGTSRHMDFASLLLSQMDQANVLLVRQIGAHFPPLVLRGLERASCLMANGSMVNFDRACCFRQRAIAPPRVSARLPPDVRMRSTSPQHPDSTT